MAVLIVTVLPCTSKSPDTTKLLTVTLFPAKASIALSAVKYKLSFSTTFAVVNTGVTAVNTLASV